MKIAFAKTKEIRARLAAVALLTVLFAAFQNCSMAGMSSKVNDLSTSSNSPGALGVSPTSIQLSWPGVASSKSYNVYDLNQGSAVIATTTFTFTYLSKLSPATEYTFSARGVRGTGNFLSDALGTWTLTTWPEFTDVAFTSTVENDSSVTVTWAYAPWQTTPLAAAPNAEQASTISCALLPVPAGTDPSSVNPTAPGNGLKPLTVAGSLFAQSMRIPLGTIDARLSYAAQCTAKFTDNTTSVSAKNFLISPSHRVTECPEAGSVGAGYSCSPNIAIPVRAELPTVVMALDASNTCAWATLAGNNIVSAGTLTAASIGSCNLAYRYTIAALNYTSPIVSRTVNVTVPAAFQSFPAFAVRALPGAVAFPHLYAQMTGAGDARAMIKADLITDFGYGSTFFAGGNTPFPAFTPSNPALTSTFFYGFPVSGLVGGVRPTGYSLDAIRANWQSTTPASEGFLRGNMVIPRVQISNSNFLTATGASAPNRLYNFLTNNYTFDGGTSYSPAPLAYYLNTIADRDPAGDPTSNVWSGSIFERGAVTFNIPSAQDIAAFTPPTGINGTATLISNADAGKTVTGLVSSSPNNSLYYVTNCQANPTAYANPAGCLPAGSPALPTTISCVGDVIIQAPLLLVNATIVTTKVGCRIHATGTIFVQGGLNVLSADGSANSSPLQLMSARAVILGFSGQSLGVTNAGTRRSNGGGILDQSIANGTVNPYLTSINSGPGAASAALNAIAVDAQVVNLKTTDASSTLATGDQTFNHLVACAPYVFSNYSGILRGALIAEVAVFPFLNFAADPALVGQTPFPLFGGARAPLVVTAQ